MNELSSNAAEILAADALCMQCGLCCDGTLYGSVAIDEEEVARLSRISLPVVRPEGAPLMPQPCRALSGCLCSVYPERPSACEHYECVLRKAVAAGARSQEDALTVVMRVRLLLLALRADLNLDPSAFVWDSILALEPPATPEESAEWERRHDGALRAVVELVELARREFDARFGGGGSAR